MPRRRATVLLTLLALGLLAGSLQAQQPDPQPKVEAPPELKGEPKGDPKLGVQAFTILDKYCGRCHGPLGTNEGGIGYILDRKKLEERRKIYPGDVEKSAAKGLLARMVEGSMPPDTVKDAKQRPGKEEIALIQEWIKVGAPADETAFAPGGPKIGEPGFVAPRRKFVSTKDVYLAMRAHMQQIPQEDRKYFRYFSLVHLHNNPEIRDTEMRMYRAALSKVVNSLTWRPTIVIPEPIDQDKTILFVDLRRLDWYKYGMWDYILEMYPYGISYNYSSNREIAELSKQVGMYAGVDVPVVRADWFIVTAMRPPLYHKLLRIPSTAYELEKMLGVDFKNNFLLDQLARAGFTDSGVSGQNRMIERHEANTGGAYWRSYDFKPNNPLGNLFRYPLGPDFHGNPYPQLAFKEDGGEIIWGLPNGLQAYMLLNGKGGRIDEGPIDVVRDTLQTGGSPVIINGLSCIACHSRGMIGGFKDLIGPGSAAVGRPLEKVRRLYPRPEDMDKLVQQDTDRFLQAVERVQGPFLLPGEGAKLLDASSEPVGVLARRFLLRSVTLEEAAYELGMPDPQILLAGIRGNPRLRELGLGPLANAATIKREEWESVRGIVSIFQETASELIEATPKVYRRSKR